MIMLSAKPVFKIDKGIFAIAGISKNSGKTSFLNWLLSRADSTRIGVLTTGRDGEELDLVFGNPKPSVKLLQGVLFTSTSDVIDRMGSSLEVIQKLPYQAGLKKLWLLKALRDIETEIVGPANAATQIEVARLMQTNGAEIVLIDGSIDRKSIALNNQLSGVFLIAGGSFGSIDKIQSEILRLNLLSQIPVATVNILSQDSISLFLDNTWQAVGIDSILGNEKVLMEIIAKKKPERIYLPGAVTDANWIMIKASLSSVQEIIIKHPLQLHLNMMNLESMIQANNLSAIQPFKLTAIAVNSWSVKGNHIDSKKMRDTIRKLFPKSLILDICEA